MTRWALVWAAATAITLLLTLARQANVEVWQLPGADNLVAVATNSSEVGAQLTVLWVSALVAMFGASLSTRVESGSVLLLVLAAMLATTKLGVPLGHDNHPAHPLYVTGAALAVASGILWAGGLFALLVHRRAVTAEDPEVVRRYGVLASVLVPLAAAGVLLARVGGLPGWADLWTTEDGLAILVQAGMVGVLAWVGAGHRRRVWVGAGGPGGRAPARLASRRRHRGHRFLRRLRRLR